MRQVTRPDAKKIHVDNFSKTYSQRMLDIESKKKAQLEQYEK